MNSTVDFLLCHIFSVQCFCGLMKRLSYLILPGLTQLWSPWKHPRTLNSNISNSWPYCSCFPLTSFVCSKLHLLQFCLLLLPFCCPPCDDVVQVDVLLWVICLSVSRTALQRQLCLWCSRQPASWTTDQLFLKWGREAIRDFSSTAAGRWCCVRTHIHKHTHTHTHTHTSMNVHCRTC